MQLHRRQTNHYQVLHFLDEPDVVEAGEPQLDSRATATFWSGKTAVNKEHTAKRDCQTLALHGLVMHTTDTKRGIQLEPAEVAQPCTSAACNVDEEYAALQLLAHRGCATHACHAWPNFWRSCYLQRGRQTTFWTILLNPKAKHNRCKNQQDQSVLVLKLPENVSRRSALL